MSESSTQEPATKVATRKPSPAEAAPATSPRYAPSRFELLRDDAAARRVLEGLIELDIIRQVREEPEANAMPVCPLCEQGTLALKRHPVLKSDVCLICWRTADRLEDKAVAAFSRHLDDFHSQLPQIVRDVRAGHDEPTFYRGDQG